MKAKMYNFSYWITETRAPALLLDFTYLLQISGFKILDISEHYFKPQGYTALFLLSESHFAVHTFPERGKTYIELTSCVEDQYKRFLDAFDMDTVSQDN